LTPDVIAACRARGVKLMVYHTENDPAAFRQMIEAGADLINCDHSDVAARVAADYVEAGRRVRAVLLDCGDTLIDEGSEVKPDGHTSLRADLIPGAGELVRALKRRGYALALVADGPVATFVNNLGSHALYDLFDAYAISEVVGVSKPDAALFCHALDALGVAPADYGCVLMVGNHLGRDIKGANALGLTSVWLDWAPRRAKTPADATEQPDFTLKTPLELLDLLDRIEQGAALPKMRP